MPILSDTVILNSPTTTERDHAVVEYLERVLALDAMEFGREMFEAMPTSRSSWQTSSSPAMPRSMATAGDRTIRIAQIETVGKLLDRQVSCSTPWKRRCSAATSCSR